MADKGPEEPNRYQFEDLSLDTGQRLVMRGEDCLEVTGLTFDLLQAIVEAAPNVISADELAEKVWSGRPTSPETITQRAMMLRQALGDDADNPRYVEVVRGHGFRLIPDVNHAQYEAANPRNRVGLVIAAIIVVAVAVAYLPPREPKVPESTALPNSVAVLPFENLSPNPDNAFFAAGIHESTLNQLAKLGELTVIARTSVAQYADDPPAITEIAADLNVEMVMEGSVRYDKDRVLITAQLIDGATGAHLWSEEYPRDLTDIFAVQADIAAAISQAMEVELLDIDVAQIEKPPTVSPAAYVLYLNSLALGNEAGIPLLDDAIQLDPEFALAYAYKSYRMSLTLRFLSPQLETESTWGGWERVAIENAEKALELDDKLAFAHASLALIDEVNWRRSDAQSRFDSAIALIPNDATLLRNYATFKRATGDIPEAIRLHRRTIELDPNTLQNHHQLGVAYMYAQNHDAALETFQAVLAKNPVFYPSRLESGYIKAVLGDIEGAIEDLQIAEPLIDNIWAANYFMRAKVARSYRQAGLPEKAQEFAADIESDSLTEHVGPANLAIAYIAIADYDRAYQILSEAVDSNIPLDWAATNEIRENVWTDPVLEEPRFEELRSRIGVWQ